jgi:hypothetical protein
MPPSPTDTLTTDPTADPTAAFFQDLAAHPQPLLASVTGTIRFDLERSRGTDHWLLAITCGQVALSRDRAPADAVMAMEKALLDRIVTGRANAMAAMLRGEILVEGDRALCVRLQRVLPGPRQPALAGRG